MPPTALLTHSLPFLQPCHCVCHTHTHTSGIALGYCKPRGPAITRRISRWQSSQVQLRPASSEWHQKSGSCQTRSAQCVEKGGAQRGRSVRPCLPLRRRPRRWWQPPAGNERPEKRVGAAGLLGHHTGTALSCPPLSESSPHPRQGPPPPGTEDPTAWRAGPRGQHERRLMSYSQPISMRR